MPQTKGRIAANTFADMPQTKGRDNPFRAIGHDVAANQGANSGEYIRRHDSPLRPLGRDDPFRAIGHDDARANSGEYIRRYDSPLRPLGRDDPFRAIGHGDPFRAIGHGDAANQGANKFAAMIRPYLPCYNRRALLNSSIHHPHNYYALRAPEYT